MEMMKSIGEPAPWLILPHLILLPPAIVFLMRKFLAVPQGRGPQHHRFIALAFMAVAVLVLMLSIFTAFLRPSHQLDWMIPPALSPLLLIWCGLNLAGALYLLRDARKDLYGLVEIFVAIVTLAATAYDMQPENFATTTIGFVGGVYVLVRGMTNFLDAVSAGNGDRWARDRFRAGS